MIVQPHGNATVLSLEDRRLLLNKPLSVSMALLLLWSVGPQLLCLSGCSPAEQPEGALESLQYGQQELEQLEQQPLREFHDLQVTGSMELAYAEQFSVDYLEGNYSLITIVSTGRFLLVPEGQLAPWHVDADITILQQPVDNIYLAATSAMSLFDALDALDHISMSGTRANGWYIESARIAMEAGRIVFAGKYNAPDYELLLANGCRLAIESTMILHAPEVMEKLIDLGIPVLVERSSYEAYPLGRTEWIKLYGLLVGAQEQAEQIIAAQTAALASISAGATGMTVAFFYINAAGNAMVRRDGDYVIRMIELAGGSYVFSGLGDDNSTDSVNLTLEQFYAQAKEADVIIYNSSMDGEIRSLAELLAKSPLFADFKAVHTGNVWCTSQSFFQATCGFSQMIADMNMIFTGEADSVTELNFLFRLEGLDSS